MKLTRRWDDAPHPVVTRHICHADALPSPWEGNFVQGLDAISPPAPTGGFLNTLGSILPTVLETALPLVASAFFPPALPFVLGGEAALNAGEGIAEQKPFGDIALGLGESAAGAALGGQFGDLGLGDAASSFFGGGVDPLAASGDAAASSAASTFGGVPVSGADVLGGAVGADPFSGITAADFGIDPTTAITGQTGATGFADALQTAAASGSPITSADPSQLGPAAIQSGAPTASDVFGNPVPQNQVEIGSDVFGNPIYGIGPPDSQPPIGAGTGLAPDAGLPPPVIPDFSAPPVTPDIPAAAPAPPAPDLTPVPTDTGVLGTSPVMEPPGMGVAPPPASVDVAAPGVGTATPGAAAGTGGAATGLTPAGALDPFGLGGTGTPAGAPGIGGGDAGGLPVPDSSAAGLSDPTLGVIPQGDGGPPGSPAGPGGVNSGDPTAPGAGAPGSPVDPTNVGTQLAQAPPSNDPLVSATDLGIDPSQAIPGSGGGLFNNVGDLLNAMGTGGGTPAGGGIPGAMIASANPADNPAAVAAATAAGPAPVPGAPFDVSSLLKYLGPALGIGGLAKQLFAPGLSLAPGQGANTAALTAAQQALLDELAALRQTTLTPAAQQGSAALTKATSTAQQYADQLLSGKLTPEQSQLVANNLAATLSTIKSRYGSLGQGTSTSEMEDEAAAQAASVGGAGALEQQNTSQGIQLEQLASSDSQASVQELLTAAGVEGNQTNTLLQQQEAQDAQLSQMIARLAAALSGGVPTYTLQPTA